MLETKRIGVEGMTCDHCAKRVEKALRSVSGVQDVKVDRAGAMATVTYDASKTAVPALSEIISKSGYRPLTLSP